MAIALGSVVEPLAVSLALGLVFGLAPAIAGARTTPIAALRDG
jgi:ABC-type antimicrobial peptide transport system permease subunit